MIMISSHVGSAPQAPSPCYRHPGAPRTDPTALQVHAVESSVLTSRRFLRLSSCDVRHLLHLVNQPSYYIDALIDGK